MNLGKMGITLLLKKKGYKEQIDMIFAYSNLYTSLHIVINRKKTIHLIIAGKTVDLSL